jgi:hypothetical protein
MQRTERRIELRREGVVNCERALKCAVEALERARADLASEHQAAESLRMRVAKKRQASLERGLKAGEMATPSGPPRSFKESKDLWAVNPAYDFELALELERAWRAETGVAGPNAVIVGKRHLLMSTAWARCGACSATIWMGKLRQSGWPFWRSRRGDDCRGATITQAVFL